MEVAPAQEHAGPGHERTELPESRWTDPYRVARVTWAFVGLGVLVRLVRYLMDYPIWHDEAFLAVNFWDRSFVDLLRPLDYSQVAPWLFLCIERAAVLIFGYSELSLRLFPTVCSIASVFVFRDLAARLLTGRALIFAVAVYATAFYPIRHGAEIKPYSSDLLVAIILLDLVIRWHREPGKGYPWWILTALIPVMVAVSYPAVFVAGGVSLAVFWPIWKTDQKSVRLAYIAYNLVLAGSFLGVYLACTSTQAVDVGSYYRWGYWANSFPPLDRPWMIPLWLVEKHTGTMMAYPVGEARGGSTGTFLCVVVGAFTLWNRAGRRSLAILLAPVGMGLLAAVLGRYPYGGAPRVVLYLAPSICLLMAIGMDSLITRIRDERRSQRAVRATLIVLGLLGGGLVVRDLIQPYRTLQDVHTREFARGFWEVENRRGEVACVKSDFGLVLRSHQWKVGMSAVYLFHQRRYSEHHRSGRPIDLDPARYSPGHPLKLVLFDDPLQDDPIFERWLAGLTRDFTRIRSETYVVHPGKPGEMWLRDAYTVHEFAPVTSARVSGDGGGDAEPRRR